MSLFSDDIVQMWNMHSKRRLDETCALARLWELRDENGYDASLFLVPLHNLPDVEVGDEISADGDEFKIEHIEYEHLYVRQL